MEADRYKKIDELFDLVLELDTFEREGYLDKACGGDVELRSGVTASVRGGQYQIWTINPDGSGAQQITDAPALGAVIPIYSPDGLRMAYSLFGGKTYIMDLNKSWSEQTPVETPFLEGTSHFIARSWSPDGRYLAGSVYIKNQQCLFIYSVDGKVYEKVSDFGSHPRWLSDNRRLLFIFQDRIFLNNLLSLDISKDNRSIYVSAASIEADIWLLSLK